MWKLAKSATAPENYFQHQNHEIAFIGPSNVGKSSLINALTKSKICRTSNTPGRTQLINFFINQKQQVIVDLPGYGYAQMAQSQKHKMLKMVETYLQTRKNLVNLYFLFDARRGWTKRENEILNWLKAFPYKITLVATKYDKLNQSQKYYLQKWAQTFDFTEQQFFCVSIKDPQALKVLENNMYHDLVKNNY